MTGRLDRRDKVAGMEHYAVVVGAGSLRSVDRQATHFSHRWTPEGVTVDADFTGAHLVHVAVAGCVLNDNRRGPGFGVEATRRRHPYAVEWITRVAASR
jgi:hypothetical protein